MNWVDLLIAAVIAWTAFRGLRTGLIRQMVWLVAVVAGLLLAGQLYGNLSANLSFLIDDQTTRDLVAFFAIILGAILAGIVVGEVLRTTAGIFMLGPMDSLGGALLGLIRGLIYVQLALLAFAIFPASEAMTRGVDESAVARYFLRDVAFVQIGLPSEFSNPLGRLDQWREQFGSLLPGLPDLPGLPGAGDGMPASGGVSED